MRVPNPIVTSFFDYKILVLCSGGGTGIHAGLKAKNLSASEETRRVESFKVGEAF